MIVGIQTYEMRLDAGRSLKSKRQVVRSIKDRLRARFNVAVCELPDHHDRWQRAELAVVSVASDRDALVRLFESVRRDVEAHLPGQCLETGSEYLEAADGGAVGWGEEWS